MEKHHGLITMTLLTAALVSIGVALAIQAPVCLRSGGTPAPGCREIGEPPTGPTPEGIGASISCNSLPAERTFGPGRHVMTRMLSITGTNKVLRGAGSTQTTLYFPSGLIDLKGYCPGSDRPQDCYQWSGGMIDIRGSKVGLEGVTVEFPAHRWEHHSKTRNRGYNGVNVERCTNCCVQDVVVRNADVGISVRFSQRVTVENTVVVANPGGPGAHIHYHFTGGSNSVINNFRAYGQSQHGLAGNWGPQNVVFSNGWIEGTRIEPDHNGPPTTKMRFINLTGRATSRQTINRAGQPVDATYENVRLAGPDM